MDLFDPKAWDAPAALIEHWGTIAAGVAVIGATIATILRWGWTPVRWVIAAVLRRPSSAPPPLRFVVDDHQSHWSEARADDRLGTHVHGMWHVSNVSDHNFVLLKARLARHEHQFSFVITRMPEGTEFGSKFPVLAHRMTQVAADFTFFPSIIDGQKPLTSDVIFVDNYGDEHRVKSVKFKRAGI